jgi:hypothetical protein
MGDTSYEERRALDAANTLQRARNEALQLKVTEARLEADLAGLVLAPKAVMIVECIEAFFNGTARLAVSRHGGEHHVHFVR